MKITQFILTLGTGGAEAIVKDYAIELKNRGHEVEVVVLLPFLNAPNEQILSENSVKIRSIYEEIYSSRSNELWTRVLRKPFRDKKVANWIARYVQEHKPDVIHIHLTMQQFFVPISDRLHNIRLAYTCHNEVEHYFGAKHKKDTENVKYLIDNNNMQMIALHSRMAEELNQVFGITNTVVLNNPINVERFIKAKERKNETRALLRIPEDAFVVGHVGRFTYQKNHEMLVRIFAEVAKEKANAFLLMIGNGELMEDMKQQLSNLKLDGKYMILSDRKDIPELLSAMDVFCFPSRFEGFGIAFLEAQVAGLKCIGADVMPESIIISLNTQLLKLDDSVESWKDAVCGSGVNKKVCGSIDQFDIKNVVDSLLNIYIA